MPEGHTIHRLAKDLNADLAGRVTHASSPQGRFAHGAALIHESTFSKAEAWGKHLFCSWSDGQLLHVHLGLIGKFRRSSLEAEPGDTIRLRLQGAEAVWQLTGPQTCAIVTPEDREETVAKLGPDPLRRGTRRKCDFISRFTTTKRPVGAVLLDQGVIAGIGNVYRAELLFLAGIHPERPGTAVSAEAAAEIWDESVRQLKRGLAWNRIVTVYDRDVDRRVTRRIRRDDALYAYKRSDEPCRRCGTPIEDKQVAGRSIWFCPTCQPW